MTSSKETAPEITEVDLGFIEKVEENFKLAAIFFPSKVGGKPAWLSQTSIPTFSDLMCSKCGNSLKFLLQIYAPKDDIPECFHRTIYLFCCTNSDCFQKNDSAPFKVYRNQLPKQNKFFSYEPSSESMNETEVSEAMQLLEDKWGTFCEICGFPARMKCSACKTVSYCSKSHQKLGWKEGHKSECEILKGNPKGRKFLPNSSLNYPEFELVTEPETACGKFDNKITAEEENDDIIEEQLMKSLNNQSDQDYQNSLFNELEETEDMQFQRFKKVIDKDVDQVLRYSYNGQPLWVSSDHIPKCSEIPDCSCGSRRVFEFQILPQLLNHLSVDSLQGSIDWGTIAVYTCANNCQSDQEYIPEFIWKQDFRNTALR